MCKQLGWQLGENRTEQTAKHGTPCTAPPFSSPYNWNGEGKKTKTSVQSDKCPHQFYSLPNGRFRRNSSEESLQSLRPRYLIIHNTFLLDKCLHVAALSHAQTCVAARVRERMRWIGVLMRKQQDSKTARQQDSAEGRGRLCHHPPTALVKAIQSILAFSSAWPSTELSVCPGESDGWTHCSF